MFNFAIITLGSVLFSMQVFAATTTTSERAVIDGRLIKSIDDVHKVIGKSFSGSNIQIKNMESLYDTLTTENNLRTINIRHVESLKSRLGKNYVDSLIKTIHDAAEDNNHIVLIVEV